MTDYAAIDAMNWSTLKELAVSPRMLKWRVDHPREDTDALELGRAVHCAILEPQRFATAYIVEPDFGDPRTNAAKAERAAWLASLVPGYIARPCFDRSTTAGKKAYAAFVDGLPEGAKVLVGTERAADLLGPDVETIHADEHALALRLADAVRSHPAAARLIEVGRREEIIEWVDEETGIKCKARVDFISPFYVLDLKSTRHTTIRAINADFARYLYHGQLAFYHDGAITARRIPREMPEGPYTIAVQTVEPHDVVPGRLMREDLEKGRALYRSLLRRYAACQAAEYWPGLAADVIDLDLPAWAPGGDEETSEVDW
jgi:hypothetical protein